MDSPTILIVEDDPSLATMVADFLIEHGVLVTIEHTGEKAIQRILSEGPDAVLLDVNLPGIDGFEVCRTVRDRFKGAILMLTARDGEFDEVLGLEIGADDYLTKPIRPRVLWARLQAQLRRHSNDESNLLPVIDVAGVRMDPANRTSSLRGERLELTTAEFDLLYLLASRPGQTISRGELYLQLHGMRYDGLDRSVDLRISRLRKKLHDDSDRPEIILSVRGTGYQLAIDS